MKIVYMGTPEFAVPPLEALIKAGYDVKLVVTQPAREKDRKGNAVKTPVSQAAEKYVIEVIAPEKIRNNNEIVEKIRLIEPDVIVVAAYGRILPIEILTIPRLGCINIHASLLPKHRGPSPIQSSIIYGDEFTGISIMQMDEGLDTGAVLAAARTAVDAKNAEQLQNELSEIGAKLLLETLPAILDGSAKREKQIDSEASTTRIIKKAMGLIDFNLSPEEIERRVRGLYPWPGTYTFYNGGQIKILEVEAVDSECAAPAGTIISASDSGIEVSAGGRILRIKRLQSPGKKAMSVADYLRGRKVETNTVLESGKDDF